MSTSYLKKGKVSKRIKKPVKIKDWKGGLRDMADISVISASSRTPMFDKNNYSKLAKDRKNQGDTMSEIRTETYIHDTFLRSK